MSDDKHPIDWSRTTFDGSRREQLRQARRMTVRQRLEALDQLAELSERMQAMPRTDASPHAAAGVHEPQTGYRAGASRNELVLDGCTPTPLASYLKALGILRLVAEQADPEARGFWRDDRFVLVTRLDTAGLRRFFLEEYRPTPIISPWNGRAGFLEGEDGEDSQRKGAVILHEVGESKGDRLAKYRSIINQIMDITVIVQLNTVRSEVKKLESLKKKGETYDDERLKAAKKEEKFLKGELLTALRGELSDDFLQWLDACLALTEDEATTAPLLGSGGNEGSMDYSVNHLITLTRLIDRNTDQATGEAKSAIDDALFHKPTVVKIHGNPGFLSPYGVGGTNMVSGFSGSVNENAWNTVLMLEGALFFAASATRRLESNGAPGLSFPFVVQAVCAGHGGVAPGESTRPELWAPLWRDKLSIAELYALLGEGRATLGRRQARNGLDMARAIASLGVDRGLYAFQRFGFFERRGQGYYVAAPLERFAVCRNLAADLLVDLEDGYWLDRFRGVARRKNSPNRIQSLVRRVEDILFELTVSEHPAPTVQHLLSLLGEVQLYFAWSSSARDLSKGGCPPVPFLSRHWLIRVDDGSAEVAVAAALAGLHGRGNGDEEGSWIMPMRAHLAPEQAGRRPMWDESASHTVTWGHGGVEENLIATLNRRLIEADKRQLDDKPFHASRVAPLAAVAAWLGGGLDTERMAALLPGLMLVRIPGGANARTERDAPLPAAYRILKPFFCTNEQLVRSKLLPPGGRLDVPAEIVRRLAANNLRGVLDRAVARLRVAGIPVGFRHLDAGTTDGRRLLAALMVPISDADLRRLLSGAVLRDTNLKNEEE